MSFAGNLKTVSPADIFQLIVTSQKTGALSISKGESRRFIYFNHGQLIYANSSDKQDMLGILLIKRGKITKLELDSILKEQKPGIKLGQILVEKEILSRDELYDCLKMQIDEIVYSLFGWKDGDFEFIEGKTPPPDAVTTQLNPMNMIMEGLRRIDEWTELKKVLPPDDAQIELVPNPVLKVDDMRISKDELMVLATIGGGKKLSKVIDDCLLDQFQTSKALSNLYKMGLIRVGKQMPVVKTSEQEQKALVELLAQVYINNLGLIFSDLKGKLGNRGDRIIFETFEENKMFYPVLSQSFTARDGTINFDQFLDFYKRLPEEARLWRIVSNFNSLLNDYLVAVQKHLGNKIYRRVVSEIKINIQNSINRNRQLALKYGLEEEFSRALRDR
ncbi:MAG TPA: hypothetical protein DEO84_09525 [candidate division Zixibacteria bacterium]|nr:hypothetical protein [candidate division Zixibacteria bacterium]